MRHNVLNLLIFVVLAVGLYFLWDHAQQNWLPKPPVPDPEAEARQKAEADAKIAADKKALEDKRLAAAAAASFASTWFEPVKPPPKQTEPPKLTPSEQPTLIALGDESFYNKVLLSTRGGGVQQVVLPKFQEADRLGREVKNTPLFLVPGVPRVRERKLAEGFPTPDLKPGKVPADAELAEPAYTIFHYPTIDEKDKYPDPKLGEMLWNVVAEERPVGGVQKVVFEAELGDPYFVRFRKIYTLAPADYHIGLKIEIERLPGGTKGKGQLRYQLSGPRGLPIEGEWYTNTFRNALVGWKDRNGTPRRQYETGAEVAAKRGGESVPKAENTFQYMMIATQYFASGVAIDDTAEGSAKNPWHHVRATTELPFDKKSNRDMPQFDDVSIRAASDPIDLAPGEKITHSYLIYNGPAKVRLLGLMEGDRAVDPALVKRYQDKLGLNTITDYHSPTWLGLFADKIYWSDLVISFTNLMHWLLAVIHTVVPSWALCIVVLTGIVRLVLLIPSKKQTKMNMRMMEVQKKLAPQFEELKKKYGDDFHGYSQAKMRLMMQHGVSPFAALGGCLILFAQMPIMMGLYFCLQESVFFRLDSFLWIDNLAAPDMTLWWSESIPFLSSPDSIGGFLYLGPYLNVLPILAVVLMIGQQLAMLPPPTDEQAMQQRMMMKIMMFIMPILFYKFAAGLALYFIIGTIWGLAERKLITKAEEAKPHDDATTATPGTSGAEKPAEPAVPKAKNLLGRLREAVQKRMEEMQRRADEQSKRQIRNEKNPQGPGQEDGAKSDQQRRDERRDKKKKRRK